MLAIIADVYTPLLVLFCIFYCKPIMSWPLIYSYIFSFSYVYLFAFIEIQFGWWVSMNGDFSSHTAFVMVMVCALFSLNIKVGVIAFVSLLGYGVLMKTLGYHSWFDIVSTIIICAPCWWVFAFAKKR